MIPTDELQLTSLWASPIIKSGGQGIDMKMERLIDEVAFQQVEGAAFYLMRLLFLL